MMKNFFFLIALSITANANAQFGKLSGLTDKLKDNVPDISSLTSGKPPISTSFNDVKMEGSLKSNELLINHYRSIMELQRTPNGGFVLQEGSFAYQSQSYCLKAGTQGPSKGVGYMFAPT